MIENVWFNAVLLKINCVLEDVVVKSESNVWIYVHIHDSFFSVCFCFVFSDQMGNKGAYIHLRGSDLKPEFHQFTAVVSGVFIYIYIHSFLWVNLFITDISADVCHYLIIALFAMFSVWLMCLKHDFYFDCAVNTSVSYSLSSLVYCLCLTVLVINWRVNK